MVPKAHVINEDTTDIDLHVSTKTKSNKVNHLIEKSNACYKSTSFASNELSTTYNNDCENSNEIYLQLKPDENCTKEDFHQKLSSKKTVQSSNNSNSHVEQYLMHYNNSKDNDENEALLSLDQTKTNKNMEEVAVSTPKEKSKDIFLQTIFPFVMAGLGVVAAGILLDKVQHWQVFVSIPEVFILVPALLGMKGNLEMTLASRLSTYANRGYLEENSKRWSIVWGNMVLVEAQAMVIAFLASLVAMILGWIPDGKWENQHAIMLCTGSLLTGAIASGLLGSFMIGVVLLSKRIGVNPDNVATPIAAALGDLITLLLLSHIVKKLYSILLQPTTVWLGPFIIVFFVFLTPLLLYASHRNAYTKDVIWNGWAPVIAGMGISSLAGLALDFAVSINPGVAVFVPIINGVGGNLVAVQASRISTFLHASGCSMGELPSGEKTGCLSPCKTFFSSSNPHAVGARVMLFMVVPGQIAFVLIIQAVQAGHTSITPQFVAVYLLMSLVQVAILLHICNWMVLRLWRSKVDPDNSAIPYLTGIGDLLGTVLLVIGFAFLWLVGDRDLDVGD